MIVTVYRGDEESLECIAFWLADRVVAAGCPNRVSKSDAGSA
jgi:hypothetical protein